MCGIGRAIATVKCERTSGPTDAPLTTKKPCRNAYSNCDELAASYCYSPRIAKKCALSCGLCDGMTPVESYTCYDKYSNCNDMRPYCNQDHIAAGCKKACGLC